MGKPSGFPNRLREQIDQQDDDDDRDERSDADVHLDPLSRLMAHDQYPAAAALNRAPENALLLRLGKQIEKEDGRGDEQHAVE